MSTLLKKKISSKIKPNMNSIHPEKRMDTNLIIETAGTHLYRYGIIFFKTCNVQRMFYYNPYFILLMELIYFTRSLVSLFVDESNRQYFVYSGDYMYFIHAKTHINIAATQYMMIGISILIMNFIRYMQNNYPVFIKCYEFLAGKTSPAKAGLRNRKYIVSMIIKSRMLITLTYFNTRLVCCVSFIMSLLPSLINFNFTENLLFGVPWSLIFAISSYYTFSSYFWHMAYFYILCHLIKFRLKEANDIALKALERPNKFRKWDLINLKRQYKIIGQEVKLYNDTYWSKYLFVVVVFLSTFNNVVLYTAIFVKMHIVVQMSLFYANIMSCMAIFFVLNTASVVYHESNQSRLILNSLYAAAQKRLDYKSLMQLSSIIESITGKRIGFHFFNMFIINYFKFFEISGMIIAYFLKITDLSRKQFHQV